MIVFNKKRMIALITLLSLLLPCFSNNAFAFELNIKNYFHTQVVQREQLVDSINTKLNQGLNTQTKLITKLTYGGLSFFEKRTGLNEQNPVYHKVKNSVLQKIGFRLGASQEITDLTTGTIQLAGIIDTLPARTINLAYNVKEKPREYAEKVMVGSQLMVGAVLNPRSIIGGVYQCGKNVINEALREAQKGPLEMGKVQGEAAVLVGSFFLPMGKAKIPAGVSKLKTSTKVGYAPKLAEILTNVKFKAIAFKENEAASLFPQFTVIDEIPTLKNLLVRQIEFRANSYRKYDQELALIMEEVIKNSDLRIRVPDQMTLKKIVTDGRFKTQLEVYDSRGWYSPDSRRKLSNFLFGTDLKTIKDSQFEVYGYLGNKDFGGEADSILKAYGEVIVTLKKDNLFDRTTFTLGDSLAICARNHYDDWSSICASRLDNIFTACGKFNSIDLIKYKANGKTKITPMDIISTPEEEFRYGIPYVEAQYHGGLSVRDIDSITFIGNHKPPKLDEELYQMLKANKIKKNWLDKESQALKNLIFISKEK